MPLVFRTMKSADGKPYVGRSATSLGVRIPKDIEPDNNGMVHPATGGMSVFPGLNCLRRLAPSLVPKRLHAKGICPGAVGPNSLHLWRMGQGGFEAGPVSDDLALNPDADDHGTIQPASIMPLDRYETALASTADQWRIEEGTE